MSDLIWSNLTLKGWFSALVHHFAYHYEEYNHGFYNPCGCGKKFEEK